MNEQITIPADGIWILNRLQEHGYVGYAVGGCCTEHRMTGISVPLQHRSRYKLVFQMYPV